MASQAARLEATDCTSLYEYTFETWLQPSNNAHTGMKHRFTPVATHSAIHAAPHTETSLHPVEPKNRNPPSISAIVTTTPAARYHRSANLPRLTRRDKASASPVTLPCSSRA